MIVMFTFNIKEYLIVSHRSHELLFYFHIINVSTV
jgi:hypothetical protein